MKKIIITLLFFTSLNLVAQQNRNVNPKLEALRNETDQKVLVQKIKAMESGSAEDLDLLIQYFNRDSSKKAATTKLLLKRYPESPFAKNIRITSFLTIKGGPEETEAFFNKMAMENPNVNLDIEKALVALAYAEIPNKTKALQYINLIEDHVYRVAVITMMLDIIAPVNNTLALDIATKELEGVQKLKGEITLSVPMKIEPKIVYDEYINNYGKLLFKAGKDNEAYKYTSEAYKGMKNKDKELTENYAYLSSSIDGNYEEALPILINAVKDGKNEKRYIDQVRMGYKKLYPGKDADAFIATLQKGFVDEVRANVEKLMINEPAPDFFVTDVNGKKITLSDFKGKIIVLDFWATWCAPCVASFPAMQIAVNRYVNDPEVKFLFIHTWENNADPLKDAKQFLSKRNYNFNLYMDTIDLATKRPPAVTAFKVNGIPAKFIIDGNGRIRFKLEGFSGTAEAAAEEVVQMIELTRNSSK